MTTSHLSRIAGWLLDRLVPARWRDSIEGDLLEERSRRQAAARHIGVLWELAAAVTIGARLAMERFHSVVPRSRTTRRSLTDRMGADLVQAARHLRANRSQALLAILTLALGIAANAGIFALANWLLLRPLPGVDRATDLVGIRIGLDDADSSSPLSLDDIRTIADGTPVLAGVTGFVGVPQNVNLEMPDGPARRVSVEFVMSNYFDVVRSRLAGRSFSGVEERSTTAAPAAIISDQLSAVLFKGQPLLGRTLQINRVSVTVVGIAAPAFRGTRLMTPVDVWMPAAQRFIALPAGLPHAAMDSPSAHNFFAIVGRRTPNGTLQQLQQQLDTVQSRISTGRDNQLTGYSTTDQASATRRFHVAAHAEFYAGARIHLSQVLRLLMSGAGFLLALACANIANVVLARTLARRSELATRLALGATRIQIARLLLSETLLLATAAAVVALTAVRLIAIWLEGTVILPGVPALERVRIDWPVVALSIGCSLLAAGVTSLAPFLALRRLELAAALQAGSRTIVDGRRWLRRGLMTMQVAVSVVLLVGAVLLARSIQARLSIDPGFDVAHTLTFRVDPRPSATRPVAMFHDELIERIRQVPGVRAASIAFLPPFAAGLETRLLFHTDGAPTTFSAVINPVRAGFFTVLSLPFISGRDFTDAEQRAAEPPILAPLIVTESVARRVFGSTDVAGRSVVTSTGARRTIVGVVRQTKQRELTSDHAGDVVFQPFRNYKAPFSTVLVSMTSPIGNPWPEIRQAVFSVDPSLAVFDAQSAEEGIRREFGEEILSSRLAWAFGVLAAIVAASGLYGVLARMLAERRRELGILAALGATPRQLTSLVGREAGTVLILGLMAGAVASLWLTQFFASLLYGVSRFDGLSFTLASALISTMIVLAAIPACRRAAQVSAMEALRE